MLKKTCLACLMLVALAASSLASDKPATIGTDADRAVALVEKAAQYIKTHGPAEAIAAFHAPTGEFRDGELYILFYDFDGICLANGFKPELAGLNRYDVVDPDGVHQIQEMIRLAKDGSGWVQYKFESPVTGKIAAKATYVTRAPGMDAFVGCGIYGTAP